MSDAPKDVANYAQRNDGVWLLAQRNPDVSRTLIGIVDSINELFGDSVPDVVVKGPTGSVKPYDFKFTLENK